MSNDATCGVEDAVADRVGVTSCIDCRSMIAECNNCAMIYDQDVDFGDITVVELLLHYGLAKLQLLFV